MTLPELTTNILRFMEEAEGFDDEQALKDTLEALEGEFYDKADGYARAIAQLKAKDEAIDAEVKRLETRKKTIINQIAWLKKYLLNAMVATGNTKFSTDFYGFSVQNNPLKVVIDNEASIPAEYRKIKTVEEIDKTALKDFLKDNQVDYAHLEQDQRVNIR